MESTTIYEDNSVLFNWKDDINIQKFIHVKIWRSIYKVLPRKTFEQMIHKFRLRHINDVILHDGEKYIGIKNTM